MFQRATNNTKLVGYSDSSHNVDEDDGRFKFKEMKELVGVKDLSKIDFKFKVEIVGDKLEN